MNVLLHFTVAWLLKSNLCSVDPKAFLVYQPFAILASLSKILNIDINFWSNKLQLLFAEQSRLKIWSQSNIIENLYVFVYIFFCKISSASERRKVRGGKRRNKFNLISK